VKDARDDPDPTNISDPTPTDTRPWGGFDQYFADPYFLSPNDTTNPNLFRSLTLRAADPNDGKNDTKPLKPTGHSDLFEWEGGTSVGRYYGAFSSLKVAGLLHVRCGGIAFGSDVNVALRPPVPRDARTGDWNDPVIYDGRASFYSANNPRTGAPGTGTCPYSSFNLAPNIVDGENSVWRGHIKYHDHVMPQGTFGCGDIIMNFGWFLSFVQRGFAATDNTSNSDKRVDLMLMHDATLGLFKIPSSRNPAAPIGPADNDTNLQLAGSYVGDGFDFGVTPEPMQVIGTPTVKPDGCLPGHIPNFDTVAWADASDLVDFAP